MIKKLAIKCASFSYLPKIGLEVDVVPPTIDFFRKLTINDLFKDKNGSLYLSFEEINDANDLRLLDSKHLLIEKSFAGCLQRNKHIDYRGWLLFDETSMSEMKVLDIEELPSQLLATCDFEDKNIDVAICDEFVQAVDYDNKKLYLTLPKNYIEDMLNN